VFWQLLRERLLQKTQVYILAGDECVVSKAGKKAKAAEPKRKRGRPKVSKNKPKAEVVLNPELVRIQSMLNALLFLICPLVICLVTSALRRSAVC
jgi:hypothetical protein